MINTPIAATSVAIKQIIAALNLTYGASNPPTVQLEKTTALNIPYNAIGAATIINTGNPGLSCHVVLGFETRS